MDRMIASYIKSSLTQGQVTTADLPLCTQTKILFSFCEFGEKFGNSDHNITRFTLNFRFGFVDNDMMMLNWRGNNFS